MKRLSFGKIQETYPIPNLLDHQIKSYRDFLQMDTAPEKRKNLDDFYAEVKAAQDARIEQAKREAEEAEAKAEEAVEGAEAAPTPTEAAEAAPVTAPPPAEEENK